MAIVRPLARAPIVEALIDLRVQVLDGISVDTLEKALENHVFGYQKKGPIIRSNFGITINVQDTPVVRQVLGDSKIVGVRLHSADEKYVAQFTIDSFTLSRLEPYESWEALVKETKRVWAIYRQCVQPVRITRTATRFINNLRLPLRAGERFEKYLKGLPSMPPDYPQATSSFLQRFVLSEDKIGATAIVTQALEQFTEDRPQPVILDIDTFRETKFAPDSPEVWAYLDDLRELKNRLFFGAIEEAAVELYA